MKAGQGRSGHQRLLVPALNGKQGLRPDGHPVRRVDGAPSCASGEYEGRSVRRRGTCIVGIAVRNVSTADVLEFVP